MTFKRRNGGLAAEKNDLAEFAQTQDLFEGEDARHTRARGAVVAAVPPGASPGHLLSQAFSHGSISPNPGDCHLAKTDSVISGLLFTASSVLSSACQLRVYFGETKIP